MVKRCSIANCRNPNKSSVSLFSVPKNDDSLFSRWSKAVAVAGMILKKTHHICERHFKASDVIDEKVIRDLTGKVLFQRYFRRKTLVKGAVPCFVNDQFIPQENSHIDEAKKRHSQESCMRNDEQEIEVKEFDSNDFEYVDLDNSIGFDLDKSDKLDTDNHGKECYTSTISMHAASHNSAETSNSHAEDCIDTNTDSESLENEQLFQNLFHGTVSLQLPDLTWSSSIQSSPDKIIIQEAGRISNLGEVPWFKKLIVLNDELDMEVYILNQFFTKWKNLCTLQEIQDAIDRVENFQICVGGPSFSTYRNVTPRCAYKDCSNHWRHNLCKLSISKGEICYRCANLDHTLRQHFRVKKRILKPQIPVSASAQRNEIKISKRALYRHINMVKQQIKHAKERANKLHEEIVDLEKGSLDNC